MIQRRDAHATTSRQRQRQRLHNRGPTAPAGASDKENEAIVEPASSSPMKSALVPLEGMSRKRKRGQESVVAAAGRGDGGGMGLCVSVVDIVTSTSSAGSTMTTTTTTTVSRGVQRDMEDVFEGEAIESGNLDSEWPSRNDWHQEIPASDDDDVSDSDGGGDKVGEDEEYIAPFEEHQAPEPLLAENTFLTPEYRVLRALGHGNFSTTYLAEQIPPDPEPPDSDSDLSSSVPRLVAIKRLKQPFAAIGENEYSLLEFLHSGRMSTPRHIISPITSFHTPSEHFHLVLEPLDSGRPVSLPPCQCPHHRSHHVSACPERHYALAKILLQLLSGLQSLHNLNLIHADLTPGNILFLPESNRIKIIDLGNAIRVEDRAAYLDDFEVQSAAYRAPEILLGYGPIGRRMDIWSAGVIAVELLLGGEIVGNGVVRGELMRSDTEGREAMVRRVVELMGDLGCYKDGLWWKNEYEEFVAADGILTRWLLENTRDEGLVGFLGGFLETRVERRKTAVQLLKHEWLLQGLLGEWGVVLANAKDYDDDDRGSVTTLENEGEFAEQEVVERASLDDSIDGGVALLEDKDQVQLELDLDIEDAFAREKTPESLQQRQTILRSSPLGAERPGTRFDRQTSPLLPSPPPAEIRVKSEPPLSISSSPPALEAQRFQFKPAQFEIPEETPQRPSNPTVAEASSTNVKEPEEDEQQSPFQQPLPPSPPPPLSSSLSPLLPLPESDYTSAISPTPQAPSSPPPLPLPEQTHRNEVCSQVKDNDGQDNGDDEQEQEQEQDDEETDFSSPSSSPPHHSSSSSSVVVVPPRSDVWTRDLAKEGAGDPDEYNEDDDVMLL